MKPSLPFTVVSLSLLGLGTALLPGAIASTPHPPPQDPIAQECAVKLSTPIPIQASPVIAVAQHSVDLGGPLTAEFPPESGISVVSVTPDPESPRAVRLTLQTANAKAGEWEVKLMGKAGDACVGKAVIQGGRGPTR